MTPTRTEIERMELLLLEAIKTSDIAFLNKTIHEELLCVIPNGQTITKEMDLASHRAGDMKVEKLLHTIEDIKIIGDTAIAMVIYDARGIMLGNPIEGKFKYLRVWKRMNDDLKIIAASCFKME